MSESLYFIAILPSSQIQEQIRALKNEVAERFNSKMALRSPGHITLHMPFRWKDKKKTILMEMMGKLNEEIVPFEVELNGFGFFEPRVVYVNVEENEPLREFHKRVVHHCRTDLKIFNSNYKNKVFRPHITIAFRDLKKPKFNEARAYFKERKFLTKLEVEQATLLEYDGKRWIVSSL